MGGCSRGARRSRGERPTHNPDSAPAWQLGVTSCRGRWRRQDARTMLALAVAAIASTRNESLFWLAPLSFPHSRLFAIFFHTWSFGGLVGYRNLRGSHPLRLPGRIRRHVHIRGAVAAPETPIRRYVVRFAVLRAPDSSSPRWQRTWSSRSEAARLDRVRRRRVGRRSRLRVHES